MRWVLPRAPLGSGWLRCWGGEILGDGTVAGMRAFAESTGVELAGEHRDVNLSDPQRTVSGGLGEGNWRESECRGMRSLHCRHDPVDARYAVGPKETRYPNEGATVCQGFHLGHLE